MLHILAELQISSNASHLFKIGTLYCCETLPERRIALLEGIFHPVRAHGLAEFARQRSVVAARIYFSTDPL